MAEGEEFDMDDFNEKFTEYDNQSSEDLGENLNGLRERLLFDSDPLITERIKYIDNLLNARGGEQETQFDGDVRADVFTQIDKYVQDSRGGKLSPYADSAIELRRRTTIKDGKIIFKAKLKNGGLSSVDSVVLNRDGDNYEKNTAKRNEVAAAQFQELIDKAVVESRERDEVVRSLPMVDKQSGGLPRDLMERLSEKDQRVVNGVLNPSDTILPETRIGDRGAIQLAIDEFKEKGDVAREKILDSDMNNAPKLFQESADLDAVVDAFEQQRIKEETYESQEEDVSRLQKIKKWFKENWLGASALGITVAGLITTIIIGARNAIVKGAKATLSFANAVKNALAKLGPWAASLANLMYNIIKAGASAITWLAQNLWFVLVAVIYILSEYYNKKE